ncbi:L-idonate 5-dehydrogenase [Actinosynnema pretiosum subsp. pretiosum]|uniref:Alcohol dehydrogenase GroES domain protein n=2 Tax=Actinosynnema TaxID=40566 RepID=C6WS59_ACTMD|nr:L-idonate 5-dehydrogenase [Actinosynnema mirum]ACU38879.1 Alcohol dehydrogenase GroES domain protein [Actinosynnema mirum DSM 43827]AXX32470.1 L-idonate 5-dehydrogenase [Actinosynnema pretiosum subsp. pretiosum]QUF03606.1 L-idonate 5-dehydrogenase [Actinosynnema pretiosum subsp. pretiosum]
MRAVVVHGPLDVRVDDLPAPEAAEGQVLVAVEWGGVCGSDLAYWKHGASGTAVLRHPLVLGHEIAGRVAALGAGVTGVEVGAPVTVHPASPEGDLPDRLAGRRNLAPRVRYLGSAAFDPHTNGGFAELVAVRADQLRPLPDGVSTRHGALAEPLAVALHAVTRAGDLRGKDVLVNGAGPIGSLVAAAAKRAGAASVTSADVSAGPLATARALGADHTVDLGAGEHLPADVEVVLEASGAPAALGPVLRATARGGLLVQVGNLPGAPAPAALGDLVTREITWIGSYRFVDEITDAVRALGEGLDLEPLIAGEHELPDARAALEQAAGTGGGKVLIRLGGAR